MNKFEKRIRENLRKESGNFEDWEKTNAEKLKSFSKEQGKPTAFDTSSVQTTSSDKEIPILKKKIKIQKRMIFSCAAAVGCVVCFLMVYYLTPLFRPDDSTQNPPVSVGPSGPFWEEPSVEPSAIEPSVEPSKKPPELTYSDGEIISGTLSEEEYSIVEQKYSIFNLFIQEYLSTSAVRLKEDNSLVFIGVMGQIMGESDYYFIKVDIPQTVHYNYTDRNSFSNLTQKKQIGEITLEYDLKGQSADGLYQYYMHMTNKDGEESYWIIESFGETIEEFIAYCFGA